MTLDKDKNEKALNSLQRRIDEEFNNWLKTRPSPPGGYQSYVAGYVMGAATYSSTVRNLQRELDDIKRASSEKVSVTSPLLIRFCSHADCKNMVDTWPGLCDEHKALND